MNFTGEITLGAIGIIVSILSTGFGGVASLMVVYAKTRSEIDGLKIGHADVKADLAKIEGKMEVQAVAQQALHVQLERIAARLEVMGAINSLPNQLAEAVSRLDRKNAA